MKEATEAIYDALAASTALVAAVGDNIYQELAPQGATYPLVVIELIRGGMVNDTPADAANLLYLVSAVVETDIGAAETLAGYIHAALHKATLTVSGWTCIWCAVENVMARTEENVKSRYSHGSSNPTWQAGRYVRVRLSK